MASMIFVIGLWFVFVSPFLLLPASWTIFRKAGFHPSLSVFTLFPLINLFILYYIAFSKWPGRPFESGPDSDPE
jgi:hypothetical protein